MVLRPLQLRGDLVTASPKVNVPFDPVQSLAVWTVLTKGNFGLANSQHASPHIRCVALLLVVADVGVCSRTSTTAMTLTVSPDVSASSAMRISSFHQRSDELGIARVAVARGLADLPRGTLCTPLPGPTAKEVCMYFTMQNSERYTSRRRFPLLDSPRVGVMCGVTCGRSLCMFCVLLVVRTLWEVLRHL